MKQIVGFLGAAVVLAALAACSDPLNSDCSTLHAYVAVVALDTSHTPVSGLVIADTVIRTGEAVTVQQINLPAGTYVVFDDGSKNSIRPTGDAVRVVGVLGPAQFSATFVIGMQGCHVHKISGPDTVIVQ
jgi:hypothetical protein